MSEHGLLGVPDAGAFLARLTRLDQAAPVRLRSSGIRKLEYFFNKADQRYVFFEMDIYWAYVARFKHKTYTDRWGQTRTDLFDPILTVAPRTDRFPLFHAKDGDRAPEQANGHVRLGGS